MLAINTSAKIALVLAAAGCGFVIGSLARSDPDGLRFGAPSEGAHSEAAGEDPPGATTTSKPASPEPSPRDSPLSQTLDFERQLATCDVSHFPSMIEAELQGSTPTDLIWQISRAWIRRDWSGHVEWLLTQPAHLPVGNSNNAYVGIRGPALYFLTEEDPAAAWELAERFGSDERSKWRILTETLKRDPALALQLAEAHPGIMASSTNHVINASSDIDPMLMIPVMEALHPGGGRTTLANDGANYYASRPDRLASASEWFGQLTPDAQRYIVNKLERGNFYGDGIEEVVPQLREIWTLPAE
ncbi:MAG: hypothetical protein ACR2RV_02885 [Verrucomicrobiales bacterium]